MAGRLENNEFKRIWTEENFEKRHAQKVESGPRFEPSTSKKYKAGVPTTLPRHWFN